MGYLLVGLGFFLVGLAIGGGFVSWWYIGRFIRRANTILSASERKTLAALLNRIG